MNHLQRMPWFVLGRSGRSSKDSRRVTISYSWGNGNICSGTSTLNSGYSAYKIIENSIYSSMIFVSHT